MEEQVRPLYHVELEYPRELWFTFGSGGARHIVLLSVDGSTVHVVVIMQQFLC